MKILHVNVSAICDKFYLTFFEHVNELRINQEVFCPFSNKENSKESVKDTISRYKKKNVKLVLLPIKRKIYKLLYFSKIKKYSKEIAIQNKNNKIDLIHAHSLYTDGGTAYLLSKQTGTPYIVAVRGADTTAFMKYNKHLNGFAREILNKASKVIFISPDLKEITLKFLFGNKKHPAFLDHSLIIPNGVDDYWLNNKESPSSFKTLKAIEIIQVGRLVKSKNADKSILAIKLLMKNGINAHLTIIGDGPERQRLIQIVKNEKLSDAVSFTGFISEKGQLLDLYRKSDIFLLPSDGETFGISYIEAMTQGLPIIGLLGSGVSGYLRDKLVGEFIKNAHPQNIMRAILKCIQNRNIMSANAFAEADQYNWNQIVALYEKIYNEESIG